MLFFERTTRDRTPRQKQAVLITGSSGGIGSCCAKALHSEGFRVFAAMRDPAAVETLRREAPDRVRPILLDVTKPDTITAAARQVAEVLDAEDTKLVGLMNNATPAHHGPIEILPLEFVRDELEVNYLGALAVTRAFLPLLRRGRGRIVNISSINGRCVFPSIGAYCAAKYALEAMSDVLRMELAPWGVHVAVVEPGAVATGIWEKALRAFEDLPRHVPAEALRMYYPSWSEALKRAQADKNRLVRMAIPPEQVAGAIVHALTSNKPKTRYLVGWDAKSIAFLKWLLPDRGFDFLAKMVSFRDAS
jgi:NAD(P)-dependent dehydrogenase (short-subunit alcohol dehydrogenase family)